MRQTQPGGSHGIAYFLSIEVFGFGGLPARGFEDSLYFSAVTRTSLGLGDYFPTRGLRPIAGIEALDGLVLIGRSSSFTYLTMERYWAPEWTAQAAAATAIARPIEGVHRPKTGQSPVLQPPADCV